MEGTGEGDRRSRVAEVATSAIAESTQPSTIPQETDQGISKGNRKKDRARATQSLSTNKAGRFFSEAAD